MPLVFVITIFIQNDVQLRQALRCINSVRKFHSEHIYLLNETGGEYFETIRHHFTCFDNLTIFSNHRKGLGELQVFHFILDCPIINEEDNVIYIHDSTILFNSFHEASNVSDLKFIWYFTNHRVQWDNLYEEQKPYNVENGIITHTDSIADYLKKHYNQNPDFLKWALDSLKNKEKWVGCFGYMCIYKKKALRQMDQQIPFATTFLTFPGQRNRVINESIFSLICNYFYSVQHCIDSLDGLYYDGVKYTARGKHTPIEGINDPLFWVIKGDYLGKISFGR